MAAVKALVAIGATMAVVIGAAWLVIYVKSPHRDEASTETAVPVEQALKDACRIIRAKVSSYSDMPQGEAWEKSKLKQGLDMCDDRGF